MKHTHQNTAIHEASHAIASFLLLGTHSVDSISLVSDGYSVARCNSVELHPDGCSQSNITNSQAKSSVTMHTSFIERYYRCQLTTMVGTAVRSSQGYFDNDGYHWIKDFWMDHGSWPEWRRQADCLEDGDMERAISRAEYWDGDPDNAWVHLLKLAKWADELIGEPRFDRMVKILAGQLKPDSVLEHETVTAVMLKAWGPGPVSIRELGAKWKRRFKAVR